MRISAIIYGGIAAAYVLSGGILEARAQEVPAPHHNCTAEESVEVDLADFMENPEDYLGQCIRGRGFRSGSRLYPDLETMYANSTDERGYIYLPIDELPERFDRDQLARTREAGDFVGLAYTCHELNRREEIVLAPLREEARVRGSVLVTGDGNACYFISAPIGENRIYLSLWESDSVAPIALFDEDLRNTFGDIVAIDADWEYAAEIRTIVEGWFVGVRASDPHSLASLTRNSPGEDAYRDLLESGRPEIAFLRGAAEREIAYFRADWDRVVDPDDPVYSELPAYLAHGCVCREEDCTNRWPILSSDASMSFNNALPYLCLTLIRDDERDDLQDTFIEPVF